MKAYQKKTKRLLDILISFTLLILLFPLFLLFSFLIKLDSKGSVIFKQKRLGNNGRSFTIYKFRSMHLGSPELRNLDGSTYNSPNDQRSTKVGRFLREWSLDELPEFWNVLKGDMSLVGPRPDQANDISLYRGRDFLKLKMKPGITGLAMIKGRNIIPWRKRMEWDIKYIENFSLSLDLSILLKTIPTVIFCKGIYVAENNKTNKADRKY